MILLFWVLTLPYTKLWAQVKAQIPDITFEDQRNVETLIKTYFKAIENRDYAEAWELTSSYAKTRYPKSRAIREHWRLRSLKLISMKRCLILPEGCTFDVPQNAPTICFLVTLDIRPSPDSAWDNGLNDRFVDVVKEDDQWRINALNTGP